MLVLTRKVGEQIVITGGICITVVGVRGDRVCLGVTAPKEMLVDRPEIHEQREARRVAFDPASSGDRAL